MVTWRNKSCNEGMELIVHLDQTAPENQETLASACIQSPHWQIRMTASSMVREPALLARIARQGSDCEVFSSAIDRLDDDTLLEEVASYPCADSYACVLALRRIKKSEALLRIAQNHPFTAVRLRAVRCITDFGYLRQIVDENTDYEVREAAVERIDDPETLVRIVCSDASIQVRRAAIRNLSNPEKLVDLAVGMQPKLIRRSVLHHMLEIGMGYGFDRDMAQRLLVCLEDYRLAPFAIALMERSGFDWYAYGSETTVMNLCEALTEGSGCCGESILSKQALALLYEERPDLQDSLILNTARTPTVNEDPLFGSGVA